MSRKPDNLDKHIGLRMKMRRIILNMTQEQLSEKIAVSFQQVQKYEKAMNRISASRLYQIAQILETDISYFFEGYHDTMHIAENQTAPVVSNKKILNNNDVLTALITMHSGTEKTHIFNVIKKELKK